MLRAQRQQDREKPRVPIQGTTVHRRASEVELLALACGETAIRLCGLRDLIRELPQLGKVKAVSGNRQAVHERIGHYQTIKILGPLGYAQGNSINLRLFLNHWHYGFAVKEECDDGCRHSLQFFDRDGTAVHKIYLTENSRWKAYQSVVASYRGSDQGPRQRVAPLPRPPLHTAEKVDRTLLRQAWLGLQDIHDLPALFRSLGITRIQGLHLAGKDLAAPLALPDLQVFMEVLRDAALPVQFYVGNSGVTQSHTGTIKQLCTAGFWHTALDVDFALRLQEMNRLQAWIVRQPAKGGAAASLELYNEAGENILQLFGHCQSGQKECEIWRRLLAALETAPIPAYSNTLQMA